MQMCIERSKQLLLLLLVGAAAAACVGVFITLHQFII
jgi:hypothetical protein